MKKFLLSLAVLALGANVMNAEDPIASIEFTKNSTAYAGCNQYTDKWESTDGQWEFFAFSNNNKAWDFIACGRKAATSSPYIASKVAIPVSVGSIVCNVGDRLISEDLSNIKLYVSDNADFSGATETTLTAPSTTNSEWIIEVPNPAANKYYKIGMETAANSKAGNGRALSITKISLYSGVYEATPEPEAVSVKNVAETIALDTKTKVTVDYPLTVAFVKNSNIFACDEAGKFIQVYGANSYKVNDVIPAGWGATYELYGGATPELIPADALPASTEQNTFTPKEVAVADITTALVNSVVLIKNVVISAATPGADVTDNNAKNFTAKVGDTEITLRNHYGLESVAAGTYDVTVLVTVFNNATSLYVTNFAAAGGSGVAEIEAAEGEAVYYNLQGVKVANPENGIYIRVQGGKSSKVLVK